MRFSLRYLVKLWECRLFFFQVDMNKEVWYSYKEDVGSYLEIAQKEFQSKELILRKCCLEMGMEGRDERDRDRQIGLI